MNSIDEKNNKEEEEEIEKILQKATETVWEKDPERKEQLQMKLQKGSDTIDDYILNDKKDKSPHSGRIYEEI